MGYYTQHTLRVESSEGNTLFKGAFEMELEEAYPVSFEEPCKWYNQECDMEEYSIKYPTHLFIIHRKGEDGEEAREFYKNGKSYGITPLIAWADFDETQLK